MKDNPSGFAAERLGWWRPSVVTGGVIPLDLWDALRADAPTDPPTVFAVDTTWDREWASVAVGVADYVDIVEHRRGSAWVVDTAKALKATHGDQPWCIDPKGPAAPLIEPLRDAGVIVDDTVTGDEYRIGCGEFFDAVTEGRVQHSGHPALDAAVAGALVSGGAAGWVWDRKKGAVISPLVAVTIARRAAQRAVAFNIW